MKRKRIHLSGSMRILLVMTLMIGLWQATLQAEAPSAGKATGSVLLPPETEQQAVPGMLKGKVTEVINAGRYTYVHIDTESKPFWVAVQSFDGKLGDTVLMPPADPVTDFYSKRLKRKFDLIYFVGSIRKADASAPELPSQPLPKDHPPMGLPMDGKMAHPSIDTSEEDGVEVGRLEKAPGGSTVSEIITGAKMLAGKEIFLSAKVVKFTANIMDKNWLHVRDGSGEKGSNVLSVTTDATVAVGDVVLIRGKVSVDRNFGFGHTYPVIIEDAEVTAK
jgi:hypothetical protein